MEKTLAYFVANVHETIAERRGPDHSEGIREIIKISAYLIVIFPLGVRCFSGHTNKYWTVEFYRDSTAISVASIGLFGISPEAEPRLEGENVVKNLVLGDTFFRVEGNSRDIVLERITGEDTLDYGHFIERFFRKKRFPGRAVKTKMLGWPDLHKKS